MDFSGDESVFASQDSTRTDEQKKKQRGRPKLAKDGSRPGKVAVKTYKPPKAVPANHGRKHDTNQPKAKVDKTPDPPEKSANSKKRPRDPSPESTEEEDRQCAASACKRPRYGRFWWCKRHKNLTEILKYQAAKSSDDDSEWVAEQLGDPSTAVGVVADFERTRPALKKLKTKPIVAFRAWKKRWFTVQEQQAATSSARSTTS